MTAGPVRRLAVAAVGVVVLAGAGGAAAFTPPGQLEIHYINVGQGGSTLIIGPDGTRVLYDFGDRGSQAPILAYLENAAKIAPKDGLHYAIVSHRDIDHYGGYRGVIRGGYDVLVANYGPGSPKGPTVTMAREWLDPAREKTSAGAVRPIPVGLRIALGDGATMTVVAANGRVLGDDRDTDPPGHQRAKDENDRSVSLFVNYGKFQYILDGDLGSGPEDCSGHRTGQRDIQSRVAHALIDRGHLDPVRGVDVMHVAHHGSESSTAARYVNLLRPEVALISVGISGKRVYHPRRRVVDTVLRQTDPPALGPDRVFQTEDGVADDEGTRTSFAGLAIGNIRLTTDGRTGYSIFGDNEVHEDSDEEGRAGGWEFEFDEPPDDG